MPKGVYDHKRKPLADRFWGKVQVTPGCWEWIGCRAANGYGRVGAGGRDGGDNPRTLYAHRASWMLHHGDIPGEMTVDHKCFNTLCVNPDHLQLLSMPDNARRSRKALATHCQRGHEFTDYRYDGRRRCIECSRQGQRDRRSQVSDSGPTQDSWS